MTSSRADDVWAGIPVELRDKVARLRLIAHDSGSDQTEDFSHCTFEKEREAEAELCDALRSLLSRLQEAEKDAALGRLMRDYMILHQGENGQWQLSTDEPFWFCDDPMPTTLDEAVDHVLKLDAARG